MVKKWLENSLIEVLPWPAQFPDLKLIENLGEIVNVTINRENCKTKDLFETEKVACESISPVIINNLMSSMPKRWTCVTQNKGFAKKY